MVVMRGFLDDTYVAEFDSPDFDGGTQLPVFEWSTPGDPWALAMDSTADADPAHVLVRNSDASYDVLTISRAPSSSGRPPSDCFAP